MMSEESWKEEYKEWKSLKPFQLSLLENGPESLSQAWLLNSMWCEWKEIKELKEAELPDIDQPKNESSDPWT